MLIMNHTQFKNYFLGTFLYFIYPLYLLYQSPSTHPIHLNSVTSITLTAYTHYGLVLQRYEYLRYHCPVMSVYVWLCPLFICKKLSYNRCFFRLRDYKTTRLRVSVVCCPAQRICGDLSAPLSSTTQVSPLSIPYRVYGGIRWLGGADNVENHKNEQCRLSKNTDMRFAL